MKTTAELWAERLNRERPKTGRVVVLCFIAVCIVALAVFKYVW